MKLTHHPQRTADPWTFDPTRAYPPEHPTMKPNGLWLSADGDWERWCRDEDFGVDTFDQPGAEFTLVSPDKVLILASVGDIDRFHDDFIAQFADQYRIDWAQLADKWSGILIAPYQRTRRFGHTSWYYPWDCASACIWDLSVLAVGP